MEKGNVLFMEEKKTEKEKEGNIQRRKIYFLADEKKNREGKGGKYFKKENIVLWRRRRSEKENVWRR